MNLDKCIPNTQATHASLAHSWLWSHHCHSQLFIIFILALIYEEMTSLPSDIEALLHKAEGLIFLSGLSINQNLSFVVGIKHWNKSTVNGVIQTFKTLFLQLSFQKRILKRGVWILHCWKEPQVKTYPVVTRKSSSSIMLDSGDCCHKTKTPNKEYLDE